MSDDFTLGLIKSGNRTVGYSVTRLLNNHFNSKKKKSDHLYISIIIRTKEYFKIIVSGLKI